LHPLDLDLVRELVLELGRDLVAVEELAPVDRDLVVAVPVPLDPALVLVPGQGPMPVDTLVIERPTPWEMS
jgi:hypothetical protein